MFYNILKPSRRRAFSLAELVVAVGILLLMLSLAGQVMSLTVQSTGQARAISEVNQHLRYFEQTIREDLRHVRAGESLIFIQGNPVNAYWTDQGKQADNNADPGDGYPFPKDVDRFVAASGLPEKPRADVLMIFSAHKATSVHSPSVTSQMQQVVYGHADLGEYVPDTMGGFQFEMGPEAFPDDLNAVSKVAAEHWHLARRSVLLIPNPPPPEGGLPRWENQPANNNRIPSADPVNLKTERLLQGAVDIVGNFNYQKEVLVSSGTPGTPGGKPWYLPNVFELDNANHWSKPFERSQLDETPPPRLANRLGHYFLPNCASFKVEWCLDPRNSFVSGRLDGEKDIFWFDQGIEKDPAMPMLDPNPLSSLKRAIDLEDKVSAGGARWARLNELYQFYLFGLDAHAGPASDRYSLQLRFANEPTDNDEGNWRITAYGDHDRTNIAIFTATRRGSDPDGDAGPQAGAIVPEQIFPAALRITVDLYDSGRRLDRPVRHVIVAPVGE